ncbi:hypothetical protein GTY83_00415 [Streptomyces sp. SID4928]|uniref:hypothetical protein n=1 Tax=unclassified Streptomyces TaxID=2593676 RepID=UPI0001C18941|nr:hypothetical protein [Streptomyces sp. ACT-1]EGE39500.1 hypothetical protein SACT1_0082 [Streptomyces sp. ACT-1]MYR47595.1 hypothetical protein [Streptomyces sp. SID4928]
MSPRRSDRPSGPFRYLDEPEWRARFVQAGLADPRCTLDERALERVATEIIDIKPLLDTHGRGNNMVVTGFKKLAVKPIETEYGTLFQLLGHQSGLAGAINQFNIRFAHDVAASTEVSTPKVKPAKTEDGPQSALMEAEFASEQELLKHLTFIEGRLTAAEKARKYDLKEDLAVSGQSERATYHVVRYHVGDEVWDTVSATAGSNRTRHRHALFGIQAAAGLLGLNQSALGGPTGQRWRNPADWRDRYTTLLNKYAEFDLEDIEIPDDLDAAAEAQEARQWAQLAAAARQVAVTDVAIVIGFIPKAATRPDFDAALASTNLRTHLRGPLDFTDTNQAMAAARKLADHAYSDNAITELQHSVLTGTTPAAELHADPQEAVAALVRLVDEVVYPSDRKARRRTTKVLVEPSPSLLRDKHAKARGEIRSALLTAAVGGVDLPAAAMDNPHRTTVPKGIITTGLSVKQLIAAAADSNPSTARAAARGELGHLAAPGLVNGKVFLGPYGSTGDRRLTSTKLAAAAETEDGVLLFTEAIDAFARVMQLRAGRSVSAQSVPDGRLRRVDNGDFDATSKSADSEWFTGHWPVSSGSDDSNDEAGTLSGPSPSEQWAEQVKKTQGLVDVAMRGVTNVVKHFKTMGPLVGPDREMTSGERQGWQEQLDAIEDLVQEAGRYLRKLRNSTVNTEATGGSADDFVYGTGESE